MTRFSCDLNYVRRWEVLLNNRIYNLNKADPNYEFSDWQHETSIYREEFVDETYMITDLIDYLKNAKTNHLFTNDLKHDLIGELKCYHQRLLPLVVEYKEQIGLKEVNLEELLEV